MKQTLAGLVFLAVLLAVAIAWREAHRPGLPAQRLVFVNEVQGGAQLHARLPDGGEEVWTRGPELNFPSAPFRGGLLFSQAEGEAEQHRERVLWRAPDAGFVELEPWNSRARSAVAADDGVLLESGRDGFSDIVLLRRPGWARSPSAEVLAAGGQRSQLTRDAEAGSFQPRWSEGRVIYVSSRSGNPELYERSLDGGTERALTAHPAEDLAPLPSPDGKTVLFTSTRGGSDQLFLLDRASLRVTPLHTAPLEAGPRAKAAREDVEREASWTPDGQSVVFAARVGSGHLRIWVVNASTGAARALTDGQQDDDQPALSPDGAWVAFARGEAGASHLFAVPLAGGTPVQLTRGDGAQWLPCWLPD